ncbi:MAG TPA: hypothetical protein VEL03_15050 [Streptosporangiaceae bacterium]|nr:hypothetical protein [Streptosporangiaceae bacterium]
MNAVLAGSRQLLRGVLPYPDMRRRWATRRKAFRLVTCQRWPGDAATGMDAAQLALLRQIWLQELTRNAVSERRGDDAALLARAALETCIVGLYCVYSGDPIANMSAPSYRSSGRGISYLSDGSLGSIAAIDGAVEALGQVGPDLDIRDLALWLEREYGLAAAARLYHAYYVPLSHLFARPYAFALMRHVGPDGSLQRRPYFPWARRSAVRMADGCVGLLAGHIAEKSDHHSEVFFRYATAHLDRLLTPALLFAVKGAMRSVPWHQRTAALAAVLQAQHYADDAASSQAGTQEQLFDFFDPLADQEDQGTVAGSVAEYFTEMPEDADEDAEARHRRPGRG